MIDHGSFPGCIRDPGARLGREALSPQRQDDHFREEEDAAGRGGIPPRQLTQEKEDEELGVGD
jgi:hypothetical protein